MKRVLLMVTLLLLNYITISTSPTPILYIAEPVSINTWYNYESLAYAIGHYESNNNAKAYNKAENAVGAFQIRQCRIDHYNKLNNTNYKLTDCYSYELSKRIFLYFAEGKTYEQAAKNWNGSGIMTITYWDRIKCLL